MDKCDHIICVSDLTRKTVIDYYHQPYWKATTVHNAVSPLSPEIEAIERISGVPEKVVTFLGRITMQKGPEFFVDAATQVINRSYTFCNGRKWRYDGPNDPTCCG